MNNPFRKRSAANKAKSSKRHKLRPPMNETERFFFDMIENEPLRRAFLGVIDQPNWDLSDVVEAIRPFGHTVEGKTFGHIVIMLDFTYTDTALLEYFSNWY
ncbi:MAG: hypothetical protein ABFC73_11980 [Clostridiaceae bacterium]